CEALAEDAFERRGEREKQYLDLLESEHDNPRAALDRLRASAPKRFLKLAGALGWFWHLHSHFAEGRAYLAEALAMTSARDQIRARALAAAGELAAWSGDLPAARASIEDAEAILRADPRRLREGRTALQARAGAGARARRSLRNLVRNSGRRDGRRRNVVALARASAGRCGGFRVRRAGHRLHGSPLLERPARALR